MLSSEINLQSEFPPITYEQWREVVEQDLGGAPFEKKLVTHTYEGLNIQPLYTSRDWDASGDPSGMPGMAPFTRAASPLGAAACGWDVRQEHLHPDLLAVNQAALTDLERGVTSLHLRFDAAARNGMTADDPTTLAGRDGIMLYQKSDLESTLKGVMMDIIGFGLEGGVATPAMAAMLSALYKDRGHSLRLLRAHFHYDPLAVYARDGRLPIQPEQALAIGADLASWTSNHTQFARSWRVGTGPYHHAGATAAQDLGISMATAIAYLRATIAAGMSIEQASKQLVFSYSLGCNFFLAIAKLRAARRLFARLIEAAGGDESSQAMFMQVRTSKRVLSVRDPWVNMLRNTVCNFAGALGGAQVIISEPFDAAVGLPDDFSRRIARNTQIILAEESHLPRVIDPAGGCWFLERLTDDLAEEGWRFFQSIEQAGGMIAALQSGWIGEQIDSALAPRQKNIATRRDPLTGVSEFPNLGEKLPEKQKLEMGALKAAARARLKTAPNDDAMKSLTDKVAAAEPGQGGLMDSIMECAAAGATVRQISDAVWAGGAMSQIAPLTPHPYAEAFESLREASDRYLALTGARPRVFLANMGPVAHFNARAGYAKNFFEAGGFEVISNKGFATADEAVRAYVEADTNVAVICSSDKLYETMVEQVGPALKRAGARTVILAGAPGANEARFRGAGVDRFIYIKCDVLQTLRELLIEEGVLSS